MRISWYSIYIYVCLIGSNVMSITLKELLDLKSTKDFTQVAGGTGLAKQVDMVDNCGELQRN